jgi:hypothetical protein
VLAAIAAGQTIIEMSSVGAHAGDGSDTTPAVRAALDRCRSSGAKEIIFSQGTYDFWPDLAPEQYVYAGNNDSGLKRIAFLLSGLNDVEIDGHGSTFICHGEMNAFVLEPARNVTLRNFSIDWKRPFHNEARILAVRDHGIDVEISDQFPLSCQQRFAGLPGRERDELRQEESRHVSCRRPPRM